MVEPYSIERLDQKDIDALFDFRKRFLPQGDKQMDRKRWHWLYHDNPFVESQSPVWVIKTNDRIAGSIGTIPMPCILGGENIVANMGVDYYVEDSFKGLPALQLLKKAMASSPIFIGANISPSAKKLLLKMGSSDLSSHLYAGTASLLSTQDIPLSLPQRLKACMRWAVAVSLKAAGYRAIVSEQLPSDYEDLWRKVSFNLPCGLVKDTVYLHWRYVQNPTFPYRFITARRNDEIRAMMVVAIQLSKGVGLIFDIIVPQGDRRAFMAVLGEGLKFLKEQGCHTGCLHWNAAWAKPVLYLFGFDLNNSDLGHLVWVAGTAERFKIMQQPRRWTISLGDTDRY